MNLSDARNLLSAQDQLYETYKVICDSQSFAKSECGLTLDSEKTKAYHLYKRDCTLAFAEIQQFNTRYRTSITAARKILKASKASA